MAIVAEDKFADIKDWFTTQFEVQESSLNGQKGRPLYAFRRSAIERLPELDFPTRRDEDWKYTSVTRLLKPKYVAPKPVQLNAAQLQPYLYEGLDVNLLVFVNGVYDESLSQVQELAGEAILTTVEEAMDKDVYKAEVEKYYSQWVEHSNDPFLNLNAAFAHKGIFIHVPKNTALERPIHLLHLSVPQEEPQLISPQSLIIAEQGSEATVLESFHTLGAEAGEPCLTNAVNRIIVEPNARVRHFRIQWKDEESFLINNTVVDQQRDSTYTSFSADLGGRLVRNNLSALLKDEHTMTNMHAVFLGKGDQHIDTQTFIDHAFPHAESNELVKGILTEKARGVFNGKILVRQDAQKINAFQQNSTLVLSDKAQMDTKPQLEIFADDVRCSHGATIGQLDEDAVFYLRSRGLTDQQARSLLQHAFIREVIDFIPIEQVRQKVDVMVEEKFAAQWGKKK